MEKRLVFFWLVWQQQTSLPLPRYLWIVNSKFKRDQPIASLTYPRFDDGAAWNAAAAVVNFDHVMGGPKRYRAGFSDWYGLPAAIASWEALSELEFKVTFYYYYDNAFRELTFIRPFRFASPLALPGESCPSESPSVAPPS